MYYYRTGSSEFMVHLGPSNLTQVKLAASLQMRLYYDITGVISQGKTASAYLVTRDNVWQYCLV